MAITLTFKNVYVLKSCAVATFEETKGNIGTYLDRIYEDLYAGENTYEDGEIKMCQDALEILFEKAKISPKDIDIAFGGDLLNQIFVSSYVASHYEFPFLGVYGACSTSMLSLGLASIMVAKKMAKLALAYTSSNYGTAERQFRYPTSYGIKKKEATTLTVSGAGAILVTSKKSNIEVSSVTFGKSIDSKTQDVTDLGSIMALAAYDTLISHLENRKQTFEDYDLILTGDLSLIGLEVLKDLLNRKEINHLEDAGTWVYDPKNNKKFAGGSGAACLAISSFSKVIDDLEKKHYHHVLLIGTGSLHSKISALQGKNIPVIAHAIELKRGEES